MKVEYRFHANIYAQFNASSVSLGKDCMALASEMWCHYLDDPDHLPLLHDDAGDHSQ